MLELPGVPFDAVRWGKAKSDKRGYVRVDGNLYCAGPAWHDRELVVGVRAGTVEILADRARHVATLRRSFGEGESVRNPASLIPALIARPRAFGESTIREDMPDALVDAIDRLDGAGRRKALRVLGRAAEASGFAAACEAEERIFGGGRVPDEASCDMLARRIAQGRLSDGAGPDLAIYDGFIAREAVWDGGGRGDRREGRRRRQAVLAHHGGAAGMGEERHPEAGRVPRGVPRGGMPQQRCLEARRPAQEMRAAAAQDIRRLRMGPDIMARGLRQGRAAVALLPRRPRGPGAHGRRGDRKTHMAEALCTLCCQQARPARFFTASSLVMHIRRARDDGRLDRELSQIGKAELLVIDELGFLPLDADGCCSRWSRRHMSASPSSSCSQQRGR
jgi:hypothetical protein